MAQSPDHPSLRFVQAKSYGRGRPGKPLWIVVHDMEAGETRTRAESTAAYFASLSDGRSVSSHYAVDSDSVVQCVLLKDTAYTVGNSQGNGRGINWELSGFASQTRAQWLDPFGRAMFAQMAPIVRADAKEYGIPLVRRTVAELRAFKPGITSHNDLRLAFGGTTHTDPGPNFPWDVFLEVMRGEPVPPPVKENQMPFMYRVGADLTVWVSDGLRRRHVPDPATRNALLACGVKLTEIALPAGEDLALFVAKVGGDVDAEGVVDTTAVAAAAEAGAKEGATEALDELTVTSTITSAE